MTSKGLRGPDGSQRTVSTGPRLDDSQRGVNRKLAVVHRISQANQSYGKSLDNSPELNRKSGFVGPEPGFERRNSGGERLIFAPRLGRHLLRGLEFLARDHIHLGHQALELGPHQGLDLPPGAFGEAGRVGDEAREFIKQAAAGPGHGETPGDTLPGTYLALASAKRKLRIR